MKVAQLVFTASLLISLPINCFLWYQIGHSNGWVAGLELCKR